MENGPHPEVRRGRSWLCNQKQIPDGAQGIIRGARDLNWGQPRTRPFISILVLEPYLVVFGVGAGAHPLVFSGLRGARQGMSSIRLSHLPSQHPLLCRYRVDLTQFKDSR